MSQNDEAFESAVLFAKKYLENILSFFGLNTDVYATLSDDVIELNVPSTHLNGFLIGQKGDTLRSMQHMVSGALKNSNHALTRVNIDIADYKKQRNHRLADKSMHWIEAVRSSGQPVELPPMNAADRRVIHKLAVDEGLESESTGEGRERRIIIKPKSDLSTVDSTPEV